MAQSNNNPLGSGQRETSGSSTFKKYEYQYHWALCRTIEEHEKGNEYVVFVELHEDVVVGDSLNSAEVSFEFSQVKDYESWSSLTLNRLMKETKESDSILVKLMQSVAGKPYRDKVESINLVATCGFNLPQKNEELDLEVLAFVDLDQPTMELVHRTLIEKGIETRLASKVQFIVPDLASKGMQDAVVGRIASLVDRLFPGCQSSPVYIYRPILDDFHRKGAVGYDYTKWDELLRKKGITNSDIVDSISVYASDVTKDQLKQEFELSSAELSLNYMSRKRLWRNVERYYLNRIGSRSGAQLAIVREITGLLEQGAEKELDDLNALIHFVETSISVETKMLIGEEEDIRGAVLCEILMS